MSPMTRFLSRVMEAAGGTKHWARRNLDWTAAVYWRYSLLRLVVETASDPQSCHSNLPALDWDFGSEVGLMQDFDSPKVQVAAGNLGQ